MTGNQSNFKSKKMGSNTTDVFIPSASFLNHIIATGAEKKSTVFFRL